MRSHLKVYRILFLLLSLATSSCSSGSSATDTNPGVDGQVIGTVTAPNGDPLAGATVWIAQASALTTPQLRVLRVNSQEKYLTDSSGTDCSTPPEAYSAADCTNAQGVYAIECDGTGSVVVKYAKGSFAGTRTINCGQNASASAVATTGANAPSIAVVTGDYDHMEDVLAKLGFGSLDDQGHLDTTETFNFTLIDGNNSLADGTYENFDDFITGGHLADYDIIFINCGSSYEDLSTDPNVLAALRAYVSDGGKLYVTDWSYSFLEQAYPNFMDFLGDASDAATAETVAAAKHGDHGISSDATIDNTSMASWLDAVTVNDGDIESCTITQANGKTGARNTNGTIMIADFLAGWVVMEGAHSGESPTIWVHGPISYDGGTEDSDAPLTATMDIGSGRVLYSSYHTADECPSAGFWPQERVLQYLIFEL